MNKKMKENTILVCGDIHGRKFWKEPCKNIENYDKVVFLGDYLDPYGFEFISVEEAIENFKEIIDFKKENMDKVILLIGNHDCSYAFKDYFNLSSYHCRHSAIHHNKIHKLFNENIDLFQIAYVHNEQTLSLKKEYNDILFTHAGVESGWLENVVKCDETDINKIADTLNELTKSKDGLEKLYCITSERGGRDRFGSCVWADVHDIMWDVDAKKNPNAVIKPIQNIKQVFGHTLQAYYDENRNIAYGDAIEFENCKMLDTTNAYVLDCKDFKVEIVK